MNHDITARCEHFLNHRQQILFVIVRERVEIPIDIQCDVEERFRRITHPVVELFAGMFDLASRNVLSLQLLCIKHIVVFEA